MTAAREFEIAHARRLTVEDRRCLMTRILQQLETYRDVTLRDVPAEKCIWIDRLIASVSARLPEIVAMEEEELQNILRGFQKLLATLNDISQSEAISPTRH